MSNGCECGPRKSTASTARMLRSQKIHNLLSGLLILGAFVSAPLGIGQVARAELRPITVEDCVSTRRVVDQEVHVSADGSRVAYVVKSPDLSVNRNYYQLYVRDLNHADQGDGRLLLQADGISGLRWLGAGHVVAHVENKARTTDNPRNELDIVNVETGALKRLDVPLEIKQFSASADGEILVFSANAKEGTNTSDRGQKGDREARGYPIVFGEGAAQSADYLPEDAVYLATKTTTGDFDTKRLTFTGFGDSKKDSELRNVLRLDLSPNGKHLLLVFSARNLPPGWANRPYVRYSHGFGTSFDTYVLGLYDLESGDLQLGFNFPAGLVHTRWSDDSQSYSVVGPSPFGMESAKEEEAVAAASGNIVYSMLRFQHVFTVDVQTGRTLKALNREGGQPGNIKFLEDLPLVWKQADGPMLVRADDNTFLWMQIQEGIWKETGRFDLGKDEMFLSSLTSDGRILVGVSQTTMISPDLFAFDLEKETTRLLTDLNPGYRKIQLGKVQRLEWTNRYGSRCGGFLIKPVGYKEGERYPMIFLAAPPNDVFISDAVYTTAYAPQSLANAGFVVVMAQYPLEDKIPQDRFPGEMKEAYNWMAMVESAVDLLANSGIVDKSNIGIGGFSRTSWLTDFTLTHSAYKFVAASSADSGIYTYGGYFEYNNAEGMRAAETELGGPPYGDSFKYWLDNAPPFGAAKVGAAVLMEYTETAESGFEFFTALARLGKVVELFRYPEGAHPLDTPFERVASLQRNIDWFRFWMQSYEGRSPGYDPTQYARWHQLREEQHWIDRMRAQGKDPSAQFLRETSGLGAVDPVDLAPSAHNFVH